MSEDDASKAHHYSPWPFPRWRRQSRAHRRATLAPVSLFKAASTVSALTLASRITGLVRDMLFVAFFGVSAVLEI